MTERMSDERLDAISNGLAPWDPALSGRGWMAQAACELLAEVMRLRKLEDSLDTEWGLVPDHADPDCSRSTGTGDYGRTEARINQQMYHHVTQRLIGKWHVVED